MKWHKEVPANLFRDLEDGRDYYKTFSSGGRATYLALIGWMAEKLNAQETEIDNLTKLNMDLIEHGVKKLEITKGIKSDPT